MKNTLLRPEHLAPIRNLNLRAKLIVEGTIAGLHKSPYHGFSAEFLEYRPYLSGEAVKRIDWRKYAKTERAVVKLFEDETNLSAMILLDKSASMAFGTKGLLTKFDYARTLAASLAWILIRQRDSVGLALFDATVASLIPPRSANIQLKTLLAALDTTETGLATRCAAAINAVAVSLRKRGLCVLISDLLDDPDQVVRGLRHLRFKRQDIIVLWVVDPMEQSFAGKNSVRLKDLETGKTLVLDAKIAAAHFNLGFREHRDRIERACREMAIDLDIIRTDEPFQRALMRVLDKRRRLF